MGGFSFSAGSSSAPTNTAFFGAMPDKFTMATPGHMSTTSGTQLDAGTINPGGVNGPNPLTPTQMQLIQNWTIFNTVYTGGANAATLTLGSTTTAPDGSTNAIHLSETTTNSFHAVMTVHTSINTGSVGGAIYRFGVFAKAAERTRIALQQGTYNNGSFQGGSTTVFDLANGVVAVAGTASGSANPAWVPVQDTIKAWPNGWYQCEIDVKQGQITNSPSGTICFVMVDSGSGNGALSNSYTGTNGNGVYVWRGTVMPPAAWGMGYNPIFFDDFTSSSTIDLNNTQTAGFNWYLHNSWNEGSQLGITDGNLGDSNKNAISVSGSVLTINSTPAPVDGTYGTNILMSACYTGTPGVYTANAGNMYNLGFLWRPPILLEYMSSFNMNNIAPTTNYATWTVAIDSLTLGHQSPAPFAASPYVELDFVEWVPGGSKFTDVFLNTLRDTGGANSVNTITQQSTLPGSPIWYSNPSYGTSSIVVYAVNGNMYQRNSTAGAAGVLPTNTTYWNLITPFFGANSLSGIDVTQMNLYAVLWLVGTSADVTHVVTFCNGYFAGESVHATSANNGGVYQMPISWTQANNHQFPIFIQSPSGNSSATASWDYVKVSR